MPDPYTILGVTRSASADEIRAAFRRQARRLHPDVSKEPDAAARFAAVAAAYEQLTAPLGTTPTRASAPAAPPSPTTNAATEVDREEAAEVYDAFFRSDAGAARARPRGPAAPPSPFRPVPGTRDVALDLPVTPAEAAEGAELTIPTPAGPHPFRVPPGTPDAREFRLAGLGPAARARPGQAAPRADLLVRVRIVPASGAGLG